MPRNVESGLEYTRLAIDIFQDRKVRRLQRMVDDYAPMVYIALLCMIFKEGYYIKWDEDFTLDLADSAHLKDIDYVSKAIDACFEVGLLSKEMFDKYQIITSAGIQKQYNISCEKSKRKSRVEDYSLLISSEEMPINSEGIAISSEEMPINSEEFRGNDAKAENYSEVMQQSKVKKSKEKKIKDSSSFSSSFPSDESEESRPEEKEKEEILLKFFFNNWASPNKELEKFFRYNCSDGRDWNSLTQSKKDRAIEDWQQKPEKPPRFGEDFLSMWRSLYESLIQHNAPMDVRFDALSDGIRCTVSDGYMKLHCSERFSRYIEEENMEGVRDVLWPFVNKYANKLRYINDVNPTRQSGE